MVYGGPRSCITGAAADASSAPPPKSHHVPETAGGRARAPPPRLKDGDGHHDGGDAKAEEAGAGHPAGTAATAGRATAGRRGQHAVLVGGGGEEKLGVQEGELGTACSVQQEACFNPQPLARLVLREEKEFLDDLFNIHWP